MTDTDSSTQWCCLARHVILPGSADSVHPANPNMYWYYVIWTVEMVERDVKYRRACFHVFSCTMPLIDRQNAFPMLAWTNCRAASSGDEDLVIRGQRTEARFRTHMVLVVAKAVPMVTMDIDWYWLWQTKAMNSFHALKLSFELSLWAVHMCTALQALIRELVWELRCTKQDVFLKIWVVFRPFEPFELSPHASSGDLAAAISRGRRRLQQNVRLQLSSRHSTGRHRMAQVCLF